MSFNRVIPHAESGYVETVFDGYEDWMSAVQTIEQIVAGLEEAGVSRVLLDFRRVDLRVAVVEAAEVAKFFHAFVGQVLSLAIFMPKDPRAEATLEAFADAMRGYGHAVARVETPAAIDHWIGLRPDLKRRTA